MIVKIPELDKRKYRGAPEEIWLQYAAKDAVADARLEVVKAEIRADMQKPDYGVMPDWITRHYD